MKHHSPSRVERPHEADLRDVEFAQELQHDAVQMRQQVHMTVGVQLPKPQARGSGLHDLRAPLAVDIALVHSAVEARCL